MQIPALKLPVLPVLQVPATALPATAWYREPWPWLLMSGPVTVIIAGVFTTVLAFRSSDGLVADDYYKQGLAINKTMAREARAAALGLKAGVRYSVDAGRVEVELEGAAPALLALRLAHPARAALDQVVALHALRPGVYEGRLVLGAGERWLAVLETAEWRMAGEWVGPRSTPLRFDAAAGVAPDAARHPRRN